MGGLGAGPGPGAPGVALAAQPSVARPRPASRAPSRVERLAERGEVAGSPPAPIPSTRRPAGASSVAAACATSCGRRAAAHTDVMQPQARAAAARRQHHERSRPRRPAPCRARPRRRPSPLARRRPRRTDARVRQRADGARSTAYCIVTAVPGSVPARPPAARALAGALADVRRHGPVPGRPVQPARLPAAASSSSCSSRMPGNRSVAMPPRRLGVVRRPAPRRPAAP